MTCKRVRIDTLRRLYLDDVLSQQDIANRLGYTQQSISRLLRNFGIIRDFKKCTRACIVCGEPVWKRMDKLDSGERSISGRRCLMHQRDYEKAKVRKWREQRARRRDYLRVSRLQNVPAGPGDAAGEV